MKLLSLLCSLLFLSAALPLVAEDAKPKPTTALNVTPDAAEKLLKENPKIIVLDVRTPEEFQAGHIPGAKNLDFQAPDFAQKAAALDDKQPYLVHCGAGGRSKQALEMLSGRTFPAMYHLNEGFKAWVKAGKPVEK
jgi:phage shock protein E